MRVCVLTRIVSQHGANGGMEKHLVSMGGGLRARGHGVTVLTTSHPDGRPSEQAEWGEIHYLPGTRAAAYWPGWFRASLETFSRLHSAHPFDLVISEGAAGERYARVKSERGLPPLVSVMHGTLWGEVENHLRAFKSRATFRHAARYFPPMFLHALRWRSYVEGADLLVAVSTEVETRVRREYEVPAARIAVVRNGVDVEQCAFRPRDRERIRCQLNVPAGTTLVMTAGRLVAEKGVSLAMEAAERLHTDDGHAIRLLIVGDGPMAPHLRRRAVERGMARVVTFTGLVAPRDMPAYLSAADVFVMPTLRQEGLPFVLLEAMSCGRPCIVTRFPGVDEVIRDGHNGATFSPGRAEDLAGTITELIRDPRMAARLGEAARRDIEERFTSSRMVSRTVALLEGLVTHSPA